jgi:hypothetical protein
MWKNAVELGRPQIKIWRTRVALSIPKTTNTHSYYVMCIAFPLQQWLHQRASMLQVRFRSCCNRERECVYSAVRTGHLRKTDYVRPLRFSTGTMRNCSLSQKYISSLHTIQKINQFPYAALTY